MQTAGKRSQIQAGARARRPEVQVPPGRDEAAMMPEQAQSLCWSWVLNLRFQR